MATVQVPATPIRLVSWQWVGTPPDPENQQHVRDIRNNLMYYGLTDEGYVTGWSEPSGVIPNWSAGLGDGYAFYWEPDEANHLPTDMFVAFDAYFRTTMSGGQPPPAVSLAGNYVQ